MSTQAEYIESAQDGETRETYDIFRVAVPRSSTISLASADLSSGTQPGVADSRALARPIAAEIQAAASDGRLVLPPA